MTDLDLDAIEARANAAMLSPTGQQYDAAVVLSTDVPALVAEVRRLREDADEDASVRDMLASLLTSTANALKGEPEQLWMHDWSDLPQVAGQHAAGLRTLSDTVALLTRERGELLAAIARVRALHHAEPDGDREGGSVCAYCWTPWPCPTATALDGAS